MDRYTELEELLQQHDMKGELLGMTEDRMRRFSLALLKEILGRAAGTELYSMLRSAEAEDTPGASPGWRQHAIECIDCCGDCLET